MIIFLLASAEAARGTSRGQGTPIRGLCGHSCSLSHSTPTVILVVEIRPQLLLLLCFPLILERGKLRPLHLWPEIAWSWNARTVYCYLISNKPWDSKPNCGRAVYSKDFLCGTCPSPFLCQPLPSTIPKTEVRGSSKGKDNSVIQATKKLLSKFSDLLGLVVG